MEFRFIDNGTRMDMQEMNAPDAPVYPCVFDKIDQGVTFFLRCDELYQQFETLDLTKYYRFTFFRDSEIYAFDGRIKERRQVHHHNFLVVTATSLLQTYNRRATHRIKVQMPVRIYEYTNGKANQLLCEGTIHDISRGGFVFLSNEKVNLQLHKIYSMRFNIEHEQFRFPAEYLRGSDRGVSPLFRYDYAFMFTGDDITEDLNRMTIALFKSQLKGKL